jgi:hypothetical protein
MAKAFRANWKKNIRTQMKKRTSKGQITKVVNTILNKQLEMKHFSMVIASQARGQCTAANFILVNQIAQGSSNLTRIGMEYLIRSIEIHLRWQDGAANEPLDCRTMLVYDRQTNGAIFTMATLLQTATDAHGKYSSRNPDYMSRFKVLWDKRICMTAQSDAACFSQREINFYKKVKLPVKNIGTGANVADINTGSLYLITFTRDAYAPTVEGFTMLKFTDM